MKELTVEASIENIDRVTDFINAELEAADCPLKARMQIDVAIDEVFSNIAYYAYAPGTGSVTVRFETEEAPRAARITFIDRGRPYDPLTAQDPDITLSAEDRKVGGLGIFLVKKTMNEVRYAFEDGQNMLTLRKEM